MWVRINRRSNESRRVIINLAKQTEKTCSVRQSDLISDVRNNKVQLPTKPYTKEINEK